MKPRIRISATTNENGRYTLAGLRPGTYQLSASAPGFKQFVSTGLVLQVNQAARLDFQLTVGEVSERVQVTAEAPCSKQNRPAAAP